MIFKDDEKLNRMLQLRREGWTYVSLALIFGVDHSSIYKWCQIKRIDNPPHPISISISNLLDLSGIKEPKREKTYQDYLDDMKRRRYPKLYEALNRQ